MMEIGFVYIRQHLTLDIAVRNKKEVVFRHLVRLHHIVHLAIEAYFVDTCINTERKRT